jgi:hypothetical protein
MGEISEVERAALACPAVREAVAAAKAGDRSELRSRPRRLTDEVEAADWVREGPEFGSAFRPPPTQEFE